MSKVRYDPDSLRLAAEWGLLKKLDSQAFSLTGTLSISRAEMVSLIAQLDGRVNTVVTKSTDFLIAAQQQIGQIEYGSRGAKYRAAMQLGITIISEEQFCDMILPTLDELLTQEALSRLD